MLIQVEIIFKLIQDLIVHVQFKFDFSLKFLLIYYYSFLKSEIF